MKLKIVTGQVTFEKAALDTNVQESTDYFLWVTCFIIFKFQSKQNQNKEVWSQRKNERATGASNSDCYNFLVLFLVLDTKYFVWILTCCIIFQFESSSSGMIIRMKMKEEAVA